MKKFSIAALILFSTPVFALLNAVDANAATKATCAFRPNAPDQHVVVKGDTLWGISGKFLEKPWCWPQVWGMNKQQIKNPHWIYPGQIVYFDRVAGKLRLGKPTGMAGGTARLSPRIRSTDLNKEPIPAIASRDIEPFLTQAVIVEEHQLDSTPRIVATQENHVAIGNGEKAYVLGNLNGNVKFQAFRSPTPLKDPATGKIIGFEAKHLGTLTLSRTATAPDEAHVFVVSNAREEVSVGDRLLPVQDPLPLSYAPHPPQRQTEAQVVSIYSGVTYAGQNNIVSINKGLQDGMDPGTVLTLWRSGKIIEDKADDKKPVRLPPSEYGTLFVFKVFDKFSYGLVMQVSDTVVVGDTAKSPE